MPSFSMVTFIVAPFIGLPLSACRTNGRVMHPSARTACPDQDGRQIRALALMNFPGDDLPAEDVHDQVEIEEHTGDRPGHPGDVPSPDLARCAGLVTGGWFAPDRRSGPAPMMPCCPLPCAGCGRSWSSDARYRP